jgi:DNA-binding transcriptional LysR family regulator
MTLAEQGLGFTYAFEPMVLESLRARRLQIVLDAYAATVPGFFLCFPGVARRSAPLRLFVDTAKELARRTLA